MINPTAAGYNPLFNKAQLDKAAAQHSLIHAQYAVKLKKVDLAPTPVTLMPKEEIDLTHKALDRRPDRDRFTISGWCFD